MKPTRCPSLPPLAFALCTLAAAFQACVFTDPVEDCTDEQACGGPYGGTAGGGGEGAAGGGGGAGTGGSGGTNPCGGCGGATPHCDEQAGTCVACLDHEHCTAPDAAQCDAGSCVACGENEHCAGVTDAAVCNEGTCVECSVNDNSACGGQQTCDLVAFACVDVAAGSVQNCNTCTNDDQCQSGHRCIPMQFNQSHHG